MSLGFFTAPRREISDAVQQQQQQKNDPFGEKIRHLSYEKETNEFHRSSNLQYQIE